MPPRRQQSKQMKGFASALTLILWVMDVTFGVDGLLAGGATIMIWGCGVAVVVGILTTAQTQGSVAL